MINLTETIIAIPIPEGAAGVELSSNKACVIWWTNRSIAPSYEYLPIENPELLGTVNTETGETTGEGDVCEIWLSGRL